jgi:hypothetical protein
MAPKLPSLFGISPGFLPKMFDVGSRESNDPKRGVKLATLASIINRYHNPQYGSSGNWLNRDQYEVLKKGGFNPNNPAIAKAQAYYSTPEGQRELMQVGSQLGGVTDFRSTRYLSDTGNLLKYGDNLIPAIVQGTRRFLTPQQLKQQGAKPDFSENTFFNETKRPPTKQWWKQSTTGQPQSTTGQPQAALPGEQQLGVGETLSAALGQDVTQQDTPQTIAQNLVDEYKRNAIENLFSQGIFPGLAAPFIV